MGTGAELSLAACTGSGVSALSLSHRECRMGCWPHASSTRLGTSVREDHTIEWTQPAHQRVEMFQDFIRHLSLRSCQTPVPAGCSSTLCRFHRSARRSEARSPSAKRSADCSVGRVGLSDIQPGGFPPKATNVPSSHRLQHSLLFRQSQVGSTRAFAGLSGTGGLFPAHRRFLPSVT